MNKSIDIKEVEETIEKKIRKSAVCIGFDVAEHFTGICILRTDNTKIYIDKLDKITTSPKDDIIHRMEFFINSLDKFKQDLKYKEYKIVSVEDCWFGANVECLKHLARFSALVWIVFRKYADYIFFILPNSARAAIKFNKNKQIEESNITAAVYSRDTKNKAGKLLHKKGEKKKIDIKELVSEYLTMTFGVTIEDLDEMDAFVLALTGLTK